ncbi:MAG: hypothetical protein IPM97_17470 [Bdellovibrionaceae bacterium]|nr:hypothetical protein [Pseudobdellovibrionaceae bacterium]
MKRVILLFFYILTGCQTQGVVLRDTPLNISETRKAIASVIGQPRATSENGREMVSKYYDRKGTKDEEQMKTVRERFSTHITILGDRRPYDIQIEVVVEIRDHDGKYQVVERDEARAQAISIEIQKALVQSRDNRNLIDDFRAY